MSSPSSLSSPLQTERRSHARRRGEGLTYVDFGPDNGAILIDLSEAGLCFQSVAPITRDQAVLLKFKLPGGAGFVESYAEVAWLDETGRSGGLRFVELSAEAAKQIHAWMEAATAPPATAEVVPEPAPKAETDEAAPAVASNALAPSPANPNPDHEAAQQTAAPAIEPHSAVEPILAIPELAPAQPSAPIANAENSAAASAAVEAVAAPSAPEVVVQAPEIPAEPDAPAASAVVAVQHITAEHIAAQHVEEQIQSSAGPALAGSTPSNPVADQSPAEPVAAAPAPELQASAPAQTHAAPEPIESAATPPPQSQPAASAAAHKVSGAAQSDAIALPASEAAVRPAPPETPAPKPAAVPPTHSAPAQPAHKQERPLAPSLPRSVQPSMSRPSAFVSAPPVRQPKPPAPEPATPYWNLSPNPTIRRQKVSDPVAARLVKIGVASAAGATLVLGLVAVLPSLRARVQATAGARSSSSNVPPAPEFQVEVADLNNRRWILKSGGDAGSPFVDAFARREAPAASRNDAAKSSSRSGNSDNAARSDAAVPTQTPDQPQARQAQPGELVLAPPRSVQPSAAAAQVSAPSIFDGITPPIGSLGDTLPTTGPAAPGPVAAQTQEQGLRAASLQSAVLLQRVAPVYPDLAMKQRVQGAVRVDATIGKDGIPRDLKVVSGDERLLRAALDAISQWRYRPAMLDGQAIETHTTISVSFQLN